MDTHLGTSRLLPRRRATAALAPLLIAALAAGCGSGGSDGIDGAEDASGDAPPSAQTSPSAPSSAAAPGDPAPGDPAPGGADLARAAEDAVLVSVSNAGGEVDPRATRLDDRADVAAFTRPFEGPGLPSQVQQAWSRAAAGTGEAVVAAVVDVSCEAPGEVRLREASAGFRVEVVPPPTDRGLQCLVPITTVAVLTVPTGVA